jgi:predicted RNA-binding Zn-ribbon protein involved in translation (DUF1610 family)
MEKANKTKPTQRVVHVCPICGSENTWGASPERMQCDDCGYMGRIDGKEVADE